MQPFRSKQCRNLVCNDACKRTSQWYFLRLRYTGDGKSRHHIAHPELLAIVQDKQHHAALQLERLVQTQQPATCIYDHVQLRGKHKQFLQIMRRSGLTTACRLPAQAPGLLQPSAGSPPPKELHATPQQDGFHPDVHL